MKEGEYIKVSGPLGKFYFNMIDEQFMDIKNLVLIAGGLGVTPLVSILKYIAQNGLYFVNVKLIYSANTVGDFCFINDILEIMKEHSNIECHLLTSPTEEIPKHLESILKHDRIDSNFLQKSLTSEELKNACYYLCGPLPMVKDVSAYLQQLSVPFDRIKFQ
ncbi:predicted protein [Naegleria gruberi]|uniref:Predicted protein n=1 Tax=Naegleria gruberi TaxID=5762 RepID=D2V4Y3_NAEGR|nr:uncharacterized protein NAEGRDRAFT_63948 [Naegleria gruberi]EFC48011.1 predicted protein [Naegleria gruberi]|eukprot:XP_002680755.1 predicted protein [Naegleria gruberi strain NEG-M]